jgi:hypothetical protein
MFFMSVLGTVVGYLGAQKLVRRDAYTFNEAGPDAVFAAIMGGGMAIGMWLGNKIACGLGAMDSFACKVLEFAGMLAGMWAVMKLVPRRT